MIPDRPQRESSDPRFRIMRTDDGSHTLVDVASGDSYHSGSGAVSECRHVYLENSGIGERLRSRHQASVLEIGFGTGMAFVLTAAEAIRSGAQLEYVAIERRPLDARLMAKVLSPEDDPRGEYAEVRRRMVERLSNVPPRSGRSGDSHLVQIATRCRLRLEICDAVDWRPVADERFAAVFFDPFSPASNPDLWVSPMLRRMHAVLEEGGRLVSYCVSSEVRRRLQSVGFTVHRRPGPPGGKREVLVAERKGASNQSCEAPDGPLATTGS